jgi:hypothetical protein
MLFLWLVSIANNFGDDAEVAPWKSHVALIRWKQFAVTRARTNDRVDLGSKLKGFTAWSRLEDAGIFGSGSLTHLDSLTSVDKVDDDMVSWLRSAFEGVV